MTECSSSTLERIHTAALAEFLERAISRVAARHRQNRRRHHRRIIWLL